MNDNSVFVVVLHNWRFWRTTYLVTPGNNSCLNRQILFSTQQQQAVVLQQRPAPTARTSKLFFCSLQPPKIVEAVVVGFPSESLTRFWVLKACEASSITASKTTIRKKINLWSNGDLQPKPSYRWVLLPVR